MIRLSTVLWLLLVGASGYAMFQVKYEVMQLEDELTRLNRSITEKREAIHVLNAEWSFLNQPARLDQLAKRYLTLGPIGTTQLSRLDALPQRPGEAPTPKLATPPAEGNPASAGPAAKPAAGLRLLATDKLRTE